MAKKTMKRTERVAMPQKTGDCVCASCPTDCSGWGLTVLRIVVGAFFVLHGLAKFVNLSGVSGFFMGIGVPGWFAPVVGVVEVVAGLALIIGIWTRYAGYLLALDMIAALSFALLKWGTLSWVAVILAALAMISMCTSMRRIGGWVLGVIVAALVLTLLWSAITGGYKINGEVETLYLAGALALAWSGPGCFSLHGNCSCCN